MEILDSIPFDVDAHEVLRCAHLTKVDADTTQSVAIPCANPQVVIYSETIALRCA